MNVRKPDTFPCIYCGDPVPSEDGDPHIACAPCVAACDTVYPDMELVQLHNYFMIGALLAAKAMHYTGMGVRHVALQTMKLHNEQWPRERIQLRQQE